MSYWVKINTWSIDGLPGLKQSMPRITAEGIQQSMAEAGIKVRKQLKPGKLQELSMLLVGLLLGILFMNMIQRRASQVDRSFSFSLGNASIRV